MNLANYQTMDVVMLMSIINMKLRDDFNGDLDALVKTFEIDKQQLIEKLATGDFEWLPEVKQFR
ncbi:DUF4250 domain-containing protein [Vibrio breoganii]|uniref:DUF4250 domain-containing protein n=1 Tax=Vibrio breoganii TaxID=553239 RepID=A0AAP8MWI5_9VIBR|nr:DUF4250 domain-containing protein [Vibrio breoganii]OCH77244.1 hypothetical protein A6D95_06960 [Vibrio breoganii]PMF69823.1 hypothetical protein BCV08_03125 [Vibrio breoganii]PMG35113.1 hypothetical protein BCU93_17850 [Vibrio breoganii]PMG92468.1 hypothetical protein BCU81_18175 [Vibrio breoganii]PMH12903.1 hypothetical protein BCU74_16640 [Vibrio breoganii]